MTDQPTAFGRLNAAVDAALLRLRAEDPDATKWEALNEPEIEAAFDSITDFEASSSAYQCLLSDMGTIAGEMFENCFAPDSPRHLALCICLYSILESKA